MPKQAGSELTSTDSPRPDAAGASSAKWVTWAALLLIALGVALRLRVYLVYQSFWWDEAMMADNVARRSYGEMLEPLDDDQAAPAVYLLLIKASVDLFGHNEYAMRLLPLVASLAALPLMWLLGRRLLPHKFALAALALFAIGRHAFSYAAEFKQYASDAFVSVILLWLGVRACQEGLTRLRLVALAVVGALAVWCSHPAAFVLACVGLMLGWTELKKSGPRRLGGLIAVGVVWLASFALQYHFMLRSTAANNGLDSFWFFTFAPGLTPSYWVGLFNNPANLYRLLWFEQCLLHMFKHPGGFTLVGLAAAACLVGVVSSFRHNRMLLLAAGGPLLLAMIASGFRMYPFFERLLMFGLPGMLLLIVAGLQAVWRVPALRGKALPVGMITLVLLLLGPTQTAAKTLAHPPGKGPAEIMGAMRFIRTNWRQGDVIYAHWAMAFTVQYYSDHTQHLPEGIPVVESVRPGAYREITRDYVEDIKCLGGHKRVWVIAGNLASQQYFSVAFNDLGEVLLRHEPPNSATTLLLDLSEVTPADR